MGEPHRIRLSNRWELSIPGESCSPADYFDLPLVPEQLPNLPGRLLLLKRRFGKPTSLDGTEKLLLVFTGAGGITSLKLNGESLPIGEGTDWQFDVTDKCLPRNELAASIPVDATTPPSLAEVHLEIVAAS